MGTRKVIRTVSGGNGSWTASSGQIGLVPSDSSLILDWENTEVRLVEYHFRNDPQVMCRLH